MTYVLCDRNGVSGFEKRWIRGRLPLASGAESLVHKAVEGTARLAHDNRTYLVPGVPEAEGDDAAVDAVLAYRVRLAKALERAGAVRPHGVHESPRVRHRGVLPRPPRADPS